MAHPEWAVKFRRPGTELRCINGRYCLYECTSVYDKKKKRAVKKTGKYLGSITEHGGFKESRKRILERELEQARQQSASTSAPVTPAPAVGQVKELGVSRFVTGQLGWYVERLKEYFPVDWQRIVALAYCRLCSQSPMKRISSDYGDSYLSVVHGTAGLSANRLSGFYQELGGRRPQILAFLNEFGLDGDNVIFDGTDILCASQGMDLPKMSKVKSGGFDTAINIMFGYSIGAGMANYYRLLPGNIKDIKAFKLCAQEYAHKSLTMIVDKGFQSEANIEFLDSIEDAGYIMALKRNTKGLDYSPFASRDNKGGGVPVFGRAAQGRGGDGLPGQGRRPRQRPLLDGVIPATCPAVRDHRTAQRRGQEPKGTLLRLQVKRRNRAGYRRVQKRAGSRHLVNAEPAGPRGMDVHQHGRTALVLRTQTKAHRH